MIKLLHLWNSYITAAVTASATSVVVSSVTDIPTAPFHAILGVGTEDEEVVKVTAVTTATKTLTVVRAQAGTTGVAHGDNCLFHACEIDSTQLHLDAMTRTLAGSTALDAVKLTVTDTTTISTGYQHALYINYTKTGVQTGGSINPFSIDVAVTTGACTELAVETHYVTQTGNMLTGNLFVWQCYVEDPGTAIKNMCLIDIGIVAGTHASASRYAAMRVKQHATSKRLDEVFYLEGSSNYLATNLFTFCGCTGASDLLVAAAPGGSQTHKLRVLMENTPGLGGTTGWIPIYTG